MSRCFRAIRSFSSQAGGDDDTAELLRELGVDYGQGYHLGRPAGLDQTLPYLIGSRASA